MYSSSAKTKQRPNFFLRLRRRQNSGPEKNLRLTQRQNCAPILFSRIQRRRKKGPPKKMFAFGEFAATITAPAAPECCGPKTPCCGKPRMAFGECRGKWQFRPKCCASAPAQQLINALVRTWVIRLDLDQWAESSWVVT